MKVKKALPKIGIALNNTDPIAQFTVISLFKTLGIDVYEETNEYDPKYPYLFWNGNQLSQSMDCHGYEEVTDIVEEFISHFIEDEKAKPTRIDVEISDEYNATITNKHITVGCQTITKETLLEIIEGAKKVGLLD